MKVGWRYFEGKRRVVRGRVESANLEQECGPQGCDDPTRARARSNQRASDDERVRTATLSDMPPRRWHAIDSISPFLRLALRYEHLYPYTRRLPQTACR